MNIWHLFIHSITSYFREKRGDYLLARFPDIHNYKICDLGGSRHYWEKLGLNIPPKNITIYNIDINETASVTNKSKEENIEIVIYDGKHIPVEDKLFDLLICNSVIEHVVPSQRIALAREMRRVAKCDFCQTPGYEFPIEPHYIFPFVHWLPRWLGFHLIKISPWRLLSRPSAKTLQSYWWDTCLLTRQEVETLFPSAEIVDERVLGFTKSYYIIEHG